MESTEDRNKGIARDLLEGFWSTGDADAADRLFTQDFVHHRVPEGTPRGPEGQKQFVASVRGYFPDLKFTIEDLISEGDRVVARWTAQLTNQDNEIITYPGVDVLRLSGDRIAELWSFFWFPPAKE